MTKRHFIILQFFFILQVICVHAAEVDFILDQGNESYRSSFSNQTAKNYMDKYMSQYSKTMDRLFNGWAEGFTLAGVSMPAFGKPHINSAGGISVGSSQYTRYREDDEMKNQDDVGIRTLDQGAGGIIDITFFRTLSSDRVSKRFSAGIWKNTDMTFMFNNSNLRGWEDVRMHFSNIGAVVRKQVMRKKKLIGNLVKFQGATLSLGAFYSNMVGREDDIWNNFCQYSTDPDNREVVIVDPDTGGKITISSPSTPQEDEKGLVHYPYMDFTSFSLHSEAIGYINLFSFLDIFSGVQIALMPYSRVYCDISSDVKVNISDDQGLDETNTGQLTTIAKGKGDLFAEAAVFGMQMNFGPVKIPFQITYTAEHKIGSVNVIVSF